jgi:DNA-directed RNA polymerase subunit alpha
MSSKTIHTPSLSGIDEHSAKSASFTIEPLHRGYGMTLGNSMRRVLLSSIAGAAVTAFKIEGVSHEFTTAPGVKEDVVEIMQNLKSIRFKVFAEEPVMLRLSKKGKGVVKAGDIDKHADVEIVNPQLVLATIDDAKASFVLDLMVETGRGYRRLEEGGHANAPSDMISIDAIFSPVIRVRYKVANTRIGQMTDLDKVVVTVDTDGTLSPKDAFEEAAAILASQYQALAGSTTVVTGAPLMADDGQDESVRELMTPIEDLGLSARTTNALLNNEIRTINDLVTLTDLELKELKGFGAKALDEVKDKLKELEL